MAKFSVSGKKRRKHSSASGDVSDSDDEPEPVSDGLVAVVADPDVLDCSICFEPLSPPVYQCSNGHVACSRCCTKMSNKCHSCTCFLGSQRCLALEKVLDTIKVYCPYARNGCPEMIIYHQSRIHKETCTFSSCSCPFPDCEFEGPVPQLSLHVSMKHKGLTISFVYDSFFTITLHKTQPSLVFHGNDGIVFLLDNNDCTLSVGNSISMTCIHPSIQKGDLLYKLVAKCGESSLKLKASVTSVKQWKGASPSKEFLLVPHDFFDRQGMLNLEICIRRR